MSTPRDEKPRIAIVGGGLAGLAAAMRLGEWSTETNRPIDATLFESESRLGGAVATIRQDGYLVERGADAFLAKPAILNLCEKLGLADELLPTNTTHRGALVLRNGKPLPVPAGFNLMAPTQLRPILTSPILGLGGKLRLLAEALVPPRRDSADESLASFAARRLGKQAFERLVQPLTSGIYTADPTKLSLAATLPRFVEMEQLHGGLLRAARARRKADAIQEDAGGARYGLFAGPRGGMEQLLSALRKRVEETTNIRLGVSVRRVMCGAGDSPTTPGRWRIVTSDNQTLDFDALILALPAYAAAEILRETDVNLSKMLASIPYASSAVAATGHRITDVQHRLEAFGLVIPTIERRDVLAVSFASRKFPGRAPEGRVLLRTFLGGAMRPDQIQMSDEEMVATVRRELGELLGVRGEPDLAVVSRFERAMPQYHIGHLDLIERIEATTQGLAGLELTGSAYRGVGIPDVIAHATQAAERVIDSSHHAPRDGPYV